jgi:hypothetical protein
MTEEYEPGIEKIKAGTCPLGRGSPFGCMLCPYGHMLECHYPLECDEAECSHYQAEMEQE